jgi:hypothetical protein
MSTISLAPLGAIAQPFIEAVVGAVVSVAVTWVTVLLHKYLGVVFTKAEIAAIDRAVTAKAGKWVAQEANGWATKSVTVENPFVAFAASEVIKDLPREIAANNITPDAVKEGIVAKIAALQAQALSTTPVPKEEKKA